MNIGEVTNVKSRHSHCKVCPPFTLVAQAPVLVYVGGLDGEVCKCLPFVNNNPVYTPMFGVWPCRVGVTALS